MATKMLKKRTVRQQDNPKLLPHVSGIDWQNIIAAELSYHRSCYKEYTQPERNKTINSELFRIIKKRLVDDFEVVETNEVVFMFLQKATSQAKDQTFDKRTILKSVVENFGGVMKLCSSKLSSFLFNDNVEKGCIIEVLLH